PVVAGHVDAHTPVGKRLVEAAAALHLDQLVVDLRAAGAPVGGDDRAADDGSADHHRHAAGEQRADERERERAGQVPAYAAGHVSSSSPSSCRSTASHRQCSTSRWISWMRAVRSCGTQMWTSVSVSWSRILPPPLPVSAITVISLARAAAIAASTFAELPLVDIASRTSPGAPSASTCLAKTTS